MKGGKREGGREDGRKEGRMKGKLEFIDISLRECCIYILYVYMYELFQVIALRFSCMNLKVPYKEKQLLLTLSPFLSTKDLA